MNFNSGIWLGFLSFNNQLPVVQRCNRLPLHYSALVQPFRGMLADNILLVGNKLSDCFEQFAHLGPRQLLNTFVKATYGSERSRPALRRTKVKTALANHLLRRHKGGIMILASFTLRSVVERIL